MTKKNLKNCLTNVKNKAELIASSTALAMATLPTAVMASGGGSPATIVKAACDMVVKIFPFVGAFFVISGVFKLIMAYRNDQPEAQAGAAKDIVIGAVFIVFNGFVWPSFSGIIF